ncbi:copper radical oxidase [Dendrothele bispora CBS 962.96]|uniref:Copper radical oxidase n=1 Tax=Dendrothele bispora (strain CBS 962.96) TaxID=1314807 RepID=A0A4S8LSK8_DENBC|nr:copper radical oxidase [Dendrothele bispora CBS 962.96]
MLALGLAAASPALAATAGSIVEVGDTKVSAMMMFVGNNEKVYILDKAEGNSAQVNGHPAWGAVWDLASHTATVMDVKTNVFCASGMHLPNGSFVTFGGNGAITVGGNLGSEPYPGNYAAKFDATYQDYDGTKAIRILNPCTDEDDWNSPECQWYDDPSVLSMQSQRWYSAAEPLGDGRIAIIGGFTNGGYINRQSVENPDPATEGGAANPTYEFFPSNGEEAKVMQFMIDTSGLNSYAHTFLMKSGKMFLQANLSSMLWDPATNAETRLPDMPNGVARVYPASGAVAMLPLTPKNNYNPTVLFCGGSDLPNDAWGNYSWPFVNTWEHPASTDCHRITPEPEDGSSPVYVQDDDMLEGRTMGQFVILPTGKLMVVNGGLNGTAGYSERTLLTPTYGEMPFGMSLASGPVGTPAEYDPDASTGNRWSNAGFATSNIPRLYHSSAILLPDASVMIAGSNPNVDVNMTTFFPTTYKAEVFYPSYFSATTRPVPTGIPSTLSYGGASFDVTIPASSYSGSSNDAAESAYLTVVRPGWTTHGMNMGQRYLELNSTYTVNSDGSITLHVSQMPPMPNVFQPGPAMVFTVVNGIPSNATFVIVGSGKIETQPVSDAAELPASTKGDGNVKGSADASTTGGNRNVEGNGAMSSSTVGKVGVAMTIAVVLGFFGL